MTSPPRNAVIALEKACAQAFSDAPGGGAGYCEHCQSRQTGNTSWDWKQGVTMQMTARRSERSRASTASPTAPEETRDTASIVRAVQRAAGSSDPACEERRGEA